MKLVLKRSHIAAGVILGSVIGYPAASVISNLAGLDNQVTAITMRAIIVALAALLFLGRMGPHSRFAVGLFAIFWTAYMLRLGYTFGLTNESVSQPASYFFIWSVGVCLFPSVAVLLYKGKINFAKTGFMIALLGTGTLVCILLLGGTVIETDQGVVGDQNRWNLSTINPITIGHIGASLVLLAPAALLYGKTSARRIVFYTGVALVGLVGLFLANSRGPVVAMMIALGFLGFAQIRSLRTWRYTMMVLAAGIVVSYRYSEAIFGERGMVARFASLMSGEDMSATVRNNLYADGFAQFMNSPIIGDGVEVRTQGYYPHNVVLEAFMTTGVIGGAAFFFLLILALRAAFRIMKFESEKLVLAVLAVQYIAAAQLSGSIYQSGAMWVLTAGVLAFSTAVRGELLQSNLSHSARTRSLSRIG